MKYIDFKDYFSSFSIFSLTDIRKVWPEFDNRRLVEWQDKNYIKKVIKGYYIFANLKLNEKSLFLISNTIYKPSYISLEAALNYYNIIPEGVYTITAITTNKTQQFETSVGNFAYQSQKPSLYFGYSLVEYQGQRIRIASLEKTILDYFYLHPEIETEDQIAALRLDQEELRQALQQEKFENYLELFENKALEYRVAIFLEYLQSNNHSESF